MNGSFSRERKIRTILRSVLWQILGVVVTFCTSWFVTGSLDQAWGLALFLCGVSCVVHFLYERLWQYTNWGLVAQNTRKMDGEINNILARVPERDQA